MDGVLAGQGDEAEGRVDKRSRLKGRAWIFCFHPIPFTPALGTWHHPWPLSHPLPHQTSELQLCTPLTALAGFGPSSPPAVLGPPVPLHVAAKRTSLKHSPRSSSSPVPVDPQPFTLSACRLSKGPWFPPHRCLQASGPTVHAAPLLEGQTSLSASGPREVSFLQGLPSLPAHLQGSTEVSSWA